MEYERRRDNLHSSGGSRYDDRRGGRRPPRNDDPVNPSPALWVGTDKIKNGGLDFSCTEDELRQAFSPFGEIFSIKLHYGKSCGFVNFLTVEDATRAIQALHEKRIGKTYVLVNYAKTPSELEIEIERRMREKDPNRAVRRDESRKRHRSRSRSRGRHESHRHRSDHRARSGSKSPQRRGRSRERPSEPKGEEYDPELESMREEENSRFKREERSRPSSAVSESGSKSPIYELQSASINKSKNNVLIWNLDETLLAFGSFVSKRAKSAATSKTKLRETSLSVSRKMEELITDFANDYFFYKQLSDFEPMTVNSMLQFDDQRDLSRYDFQADDLRSRQPSSEDRTKAAYRFRKIREQYENPDFPRRILSDLNREIGKAFDQIENLTDGWFNYARQALSASSDRPNMVNIFLTSNNLVFAIAKLIAFRFNEKVKINSVYSYSSVGKRSVIDEIRDSYPGADLVMIGDLEDEELCQQKEIPFRRISGLDDLKQLQGWLTGDNPSTPSVPQSSSRSEKPTPKVPESPKATLKTPRDKTPADNDFEFLDFDSKPNIQGSKSLGYEPYTPLSDDLQNIYPKYGEFPSSGLNLNSEALEDWNDENYIFQ